MHSPTASATSKLSALQAFSVVGPALCIVHCLALPVILTLLPVFGFSGGLPCGLDEKVIVMIVLPLCALAIVPGYLRHRRARVIVSMVAGMSLVLFGSFQAHQLWGHNAEMVINLFGSACLIAASVMNMRLGGACGNACHSGAEHEQGHVHGKSCGHQSVVHADHTDYLVGQSLHSPHASHCDHHGVVEPVSSSRV